MKKYSLLMTAAVCVLLLVAPVAMADLINPTYGTGTNDDGTFFTNLYGSSVTLISKVDTHEVGGETRDGVLPDELIVNPPNPYDEPSATISWDLTGDGYIALYVAVKDGNKVGPDDQKWLYYTVDVTQQIIGDGAVSTQELYSGGGDISHISLYGAAGTPIPEPATMFLLGAGLIGLAGYGRKKVFKK